MFSENNAYYYQQAELELFERQLPHKSIKLPLKHRERNQRILTQVQRKHQVEQLRTQIMDKCKFQQLQYLQLLKRQRDLMEEDIKRRKQLIYQHRMDYNIASNKNNQNQAKKIKDSLDNLQYEQQEDRYKPKTERAESAYSSSISSFIGSRIITPLNLVKNHQEAMPVKAAKQVLKDEEVKKLKQEMLNKYKFAGQDGKKPMKPSQRQEQTEVKWWVDKVKKHREQQQKSSNKPKDESTILSDTDSDISVK